MIVDKNNYDEFCKNYFTVLPNKISVKNEELFLTIDDFNEVTNTKEAKQARNIIYIWRTEKKIPRLKGSSNIVYIGQTKKSFFSRHGHSSLKASSKANKQKYNDIVQIYGPMTVSYIKLDDFLPNSNLLTAEGQFLWWYFQNHSEYPPINYTKTKIRNDNVVVDL
jgi:hypothetical protein